MTNLDTAPMSTDAVDRLLERYGIEYWTMNELGQTIRRADLAAEITGDEEGRNSDAYDEGHSDGYDLGYDEGAEVSGERLQEEYERGQQRGYEQAKRDLTGSPAPTDASADPTG